MRIYLAKTLIQGLNQIFELRPRYLLVDTKNEIVDAFFVFETWSDQSLADLELFPFLGSHLAPLKARNAL